MSKRSQKELRENNELLSSLAPVAAITVLLSYFQYRHLKKMHLTSPQVQRIDDPEGNYPIVIFATLGIVVVVASVYGAAAWTFKGHAAYTPLVALATYGGWLLIKRLLDAQAACLLGVVVNDVTGTLTFPTFFPSLTTVLLAQIVQITREDGNKLHIAGDFGSHTLRFSDKRRRDECIYLLKSQTGAKMPMEFE